MRKCSYDNHRDRAGKPPPRRQQDREVLIRKPSTVEGALRAERYVARAVSQPRFAQTSSVAAALFIV